MEHPYWNEHYQSFETQQPTDFSRYCAARYLRPSDMLIELGCGNGRDAELLASHVSKYMGIDVCSVAVGAFTRSMERRPLNGKCRPDVLQSDFTSVDFNQFGAGSPRVALYSRFSLHSITYAEQDRLFQNIANIHTPPWILMVEARTIYDHLYGVGRSVGPHEFETDHYRRFIDPTAFVREMSQRFEIVYFEVAHGLARYKDEDPVVMRAVLGSRADGTVAKA